jgi:hypothetical protein
VKSDPPIRTLIKPANATDTFLRRLAEATDGLDVRRALADRTHPATQRTLAQAERARRRA